MPPRCCVSKCTNYYRPSSRHVIKFHELPKNPELSQKWIEVIEMNSKNKTDVMNLKVCSSHFKVDDYVESLSGNKSLKSKSLFKQNTYPF